MNVVGIIFLVLILQAEDSLCEDGKREISVKSIAVAPVIDGRLTDECWKQVEAESIFTQIFPLCGKKATVRTVVKVIQDSSRLFISFYCQKLPEISPVTTVLKEDVLGMNDQVMVILDTFSDKSKGYLFAVNPLNVKTEAKISRDGNVVDTQWDEIWYSATAVEATGWTAEVAIPFDVLHFKIGEERSWNVNFIRVDYGSLPEPEWSVWSYTGANPYRVSKAGKLIFEGKIKFSAPLNLVPYGSLREGGDKKIGGDIERDFPTLMDVGFSIFTDPAYYDVNHDKICISPSQDEVLTIHEERNILLENRVLFSAPYPLINTRKIDTVKYAWRVAGKAGEYDAAYLSAKIENPEQNYSFLCVERGFGDGSSISWYDLKADTNRIMSTQADFSLPQEIRPKLQYSWNLEEKSSPALFYFDISRETSALAFDLGYSNIHSDFTADMGIISETGENYWIGGSYNLRINKFLYKITPSFFYNSNETKGGVSLLFKNKSEMGMEYTWHGNNEAPVYFIGYNENSWAPSFRISYLPDIEKTCLTGRLSFLGKLSPDFTLSLLHFNEDSVSVDFGLTGLLNDKLLFRVFTQKPEINEFISTKVVLRYRYLSQGYLSIVYGESREFSNSEFTRTDYIIEAKVSHLFAISGEKLAKWAF